MRVALSIPLEELPIASSESCLFAEFRESFTRRLAEARELEVTRGDQSRQTLVMILEVP